MTASMTEARIELGSPDTTAGWRTALTRTLSQAGIEDPAREAVMLLRAHGLDPTLAPNDPVSPAAAAALQAGAERRAAGAPMAHILGRKAFWTLDLAVTPDVLIPRPETEHLVEALLAAHCHRRDGGPAAILDLGVGSGAILLAVLSECPHAFGVGVDRSSAALNVARANARAVGLAGRTGWVCADWTAPIAGRFDLIAANPPYIASKDMASLDRSVAEHEPHLALDGGPDGLDAYRAIAPAALGLLRHGGAVGVEVGQGQADAVACLFSAAGLVEVKVCQDLAGIDRVVVGRAPR